VSLVVQKSVHYISKHAQKKDDSIVFF